MATNQQRTFNPSHYWLNDIHLIKIEPFANLIFKLKMWFLKCDILSKHLYKPGTQSIEKNIKSFTIKEYFVKTN